MDFLRERSNAFHPTREIQSQRVKLSNQCGRQWPLKREGEWSLSGSWVTFSTVLVCLPAILSFATISWIHVSLTAKPTQGTNSFFHHQTLSSTWWYLLLLSCSFFPLYFSRILKSKSIFIQGNVVWQTASFVPKETIPTPNNCLFRLSLYLRITWNLEKTTDTRLHHISHYAQAWDL